MTPMNQEQQLTDYLVKRYNPLTVLIHGSRASGYAREHSDWDFAIIIDKDTEVEREIINGANLEIRVLKLPFEEQKIIADKWLALRKGNIKVVYDPQNVAEPIIEKITEYYNKPIEWTHAEIFGHKAWYRSHIDGMIDYQNDHLAFYRKLGELYTRSIMYWFHYLHNAYMPQVYLSLPRIEKEDPEHYELLKILAGNGTNQEKIEAAEQIYKRIWK